MRGPVEVIEISKRLASKRFAAGMNGETIAIVSHGGANRIVLAAALQIPTACIFRLAQTTQR